MMLILFAVALPRQPEPVIIETTGESIHDDTHEEERELPVPTVFHVEIESGLRTSLFPDCMLCGESTGISGHNDTDCNQCGEFACSSFGCGRCALLEDVDR
jgi:hypothetical protein